MLSRNEPPIISVKWDTYNSTLLLGKLARDVQKTKTPCDAYLKPGSLETIVHFLLEGADSGFLLLNVYDYIKRRRKKKPNLGAPSINTEFLVEMTRARIRKLARISGLKLIGLKKRDDGTAMTFKDEEGQTHYCFVNYSGELTSYDGPSTALRRKARRH